MPARRRRSPRNAAPEGTLTSDLAAPATSPDAWLVHEYTLGLQAGVRQHVRSPQTVRTYRAGLQHLAAFLRDRGLPPLGEAKREHIQQWVLAMRRDTTQMRSPTRRPRMDVGGAAIWRRPVGVRRVPLITR